MFGFGLATRIYVTTGAADMRKGFNGLYGLVRDQLGCDPESGHVFLFTNARRNRLKLLVYDHSGLWICSKQLDGTGTARSEHDTRSQSIDFVRRFQTFDLLDTCFHPDASHKNFAKKRVLC
jgi:hypothetical protein